MNRPFFRVLIGGLLAISFGLTCLAGDTKGNLRITVIDDQGAPVAGAKIHLEYAERDQERGKFSMDRETNKRGILILAGLQPFFYKITISAEDYVPMEFSAVKVRLGLTVKLPVELVPTLGPANRGNQSQTQSQSQTQRAAADNPDYIQRYNEARALMDLKDWPTALEILSETTSPREEWPFEFIFALAICKKNVADFQGAIDLLESVQDEGTGIPMEIQYNKAVCFVKMKKWKKALHFADLVLEMEPDQPSALEIRATSLDKLGRKKEASAAMEKAAESSGNSVSLWYRNGVIAFNGKNNQKAVTMMQKVIEADPDVADAHKILGFALMRLGRLDEAKPHLQNYLDIAPADASDRAMIEGLVKG